MSSFTKAEYIARLITTSKVAADINTESAEALENIIDEALEAFSRYSPEVQWAINNTVVDGQDLYDYPANALSIIQLRDSDSLSEIEFVTEDQGSGDKIRPGSALQRSYESMLDKPYYYDPLRRSSDTALITGYAAFDIEYTLLQTFATIKDTSLPALKSLIEHFCLLHKAQHVEDYTDITDTDATGATTTFRLSSMATAYERQATSKLNEFLGQIGGGRKAFGSRG